MEKYTVAFLEEPDNRKTVPKDRIKVVYDTDDNVLFGSRYVKGKVEYNYVSAEYMETNRPYIISTSIAYDGKGNINLPEGSQMVPFKDLPTMFPDNKYS